MHRTLAALIGCAVAAAFASPAMAQITIDTRNSAPDTDAALGEYVDTRVSDTRYTYNQCWTSGGYVPCGPYTTGSFYTSYQYSNLAVGQTFTAPVGAAALSDFSVWLRGSAPALRFDAYLMEWNPTYGTQGQRLLYSSQATRDTRSGPNSASWTQYTFGLGASGVAVNPGAMYVMFLTAADYQQGNPYAYWAGVGMETSDTYSGGSLVTNQQWDWWQTDCYFGCQDREGNWDTPSSAHPRSTTSWNRSNQHLAFEANFSPSSATVTPEPVSTALLGTGLAGIGALRRRRRKAEEAESN